MGLLPQAWRAAAAARKSAACSSKGGKVTAPPFAISASLRSRFHLWSLGRPLCAMSRRSPPHPARARSCRSVPVVARRANPVCRRRARRQGPGDLLHLHQRWLRPSPTYREHSRTANVTRRSGGVAWHTTSNSLSREAASDVRLRATSRTTTAPAPASRLLPSLPPPVLPLSQSTPLSSS